jgi:ParB family transcriptional regulator, chromosome partitioning protein
MTKRRVFDIDFPGDTPAEPPAPAAEHRRGPMAAAIVENADALAERSVGEAAIRAENDLLAHEHVRLKKLGLITDLIPVDAIRVGKLTRDRRPDRDPELDELKTSIRAIGLSNPIRVEQTEDGYELVQGFRRLMAYRELHDETGEEQFARIPAGLLPRGESLDSLYRRMVDENLVRRDISFAEMGMLVLNYMEDHPAEGVDLHLVTERLYSSANRQKRGHIRTFVRMMQDIGHALRHPEAIPRALGSDLVRKFEEDDGLAAQVAAQLNLLPEVATAEEELGVLRAALDNRAPPPVRPTPRTKAVGKTTLKLARPEGLAKCTAADGKVELRLDRDFSVIERARLEQAVEAFLDALDG